jgi:hypothetical protein
LKTDLYQMVLHRPFEPAELIRTYGEAHDSEIRAIHIKASLIFVVLVLIVAFSPPSTACSVAGCLGDGVEMHSKFTVAITHQGKPLPGVSIEIRGFGGEKYDSKLFSGLTASDGKANVGALPPGLYWLDAEYLGIFAGSQCFHVATGATGKAKKRLTYEWGDLALGVRQMEGRLIDLQPGQGGTPLSNLIHRVEVPIVHAKVKLQNPLTTSVYTAETDEHGYFRFGEVPPGTYVLHIDGGAVTNGREYESTDLLVALSKKAKSDTLLLSRRDAGAGSCGGIYMELRNAPN